MIFISKKKYLVVFIYIFIFVNLSITKINIFLFSLIKIKKVPKSYLKRTLVLNQANYYGDGGSRTHVRRHRILKLLRV